MKASMYSGKVFLCGVMGIGALTLSASAQDSKPLPAAPSAVLEEQQQPPQPPPASAPKAANPATGRNSGPSDTKPANPADNTKPAAPGDTNAPAKADELKPPTNPQPS